MSAPTRKQIPHLFAFLVALGSRQSLWAKRTIAGAPGGRILLLRIYREMLVLKTLGHSFGLFRLNLFGRSVQ